MSSFGRVAGFDLRDGARSYVIQGLGELFCMETSQLRWFI